MDSGNRECGPVSERLGRVLSRIDDRVDRMLAPPADAQAMAREIEQDTTELQRLLGLLTDPEATGADRDRADVNETVNRCVPTELEAVGYPLVIQQHLGNDLPTVACSSTDLALAVQRALTIAAAHTGHGGTVAIATSAQDDAVHLELSCHGSDSGNAHTHDRTITLREFVSQFGGHCEATVDGHGSMQLQMDLPASRAGDSR